MTRYLYGSGGPDILDAIYADNYVIYGYGSWDDIYASDYADFVSGGGGDDLIYGFGGWDDLYGDSGWDTIYGGAGADLIVGGDGDDDLHGGKGNDDLFGGNGWDWIQGGAGSDELQGGDGEDLLEGGSGQDWVHGGRDDDLLWGGGGFDTFVFNSGDDKDVIEDFTFDVDVIRLDVYGINSFADVKAHMEYDNGYTLIDFGNHDRLWITDTHPSQFIASDFIIV
jgi:Ca2+-binding RTX toxin-like protein